MRIDFAGLITAGWRLLRRDADLLTRIAGLFFFLPAYALVLLVPPVPLPDSGIDDRQAQAEQWTNALQDWLGHYGLGSAIAYFVAYFGMAVILALYLSDERPTLGEALRRAVRLYPRFLLAVVTVSIPTGAGMYLLLIPGLYLMARFMLAGPMVIGKQPIGVLAAIGRSWRATRQAQFALLGAVAFIYLAAMLLGQPFMLLGQWLSGSGGDNPAALAITGALASLVAAAAQLASVLVAVVAYRRLAR